MPKTLQVLYFTEYWSYIQFTIVEIDWIEQLVLFNQMLYFEQILLDIPVLPPLISLVSPMMSPMEINVTIVMDGAAQTQGTV